MPVQSLVESLARSRSLRDVHDACTRACESWGFSHFHYSGYVRGVLNKSRFVFVSDYPQDWWDHYNDNDFYFSDPLVHYSACHVTPVLWEQFFKWDETRFGGKREVLIAAKEFGLQHGVTAPVHSPHGNRGSLSMIASDAGPLSLGDERVAKIQLLAACVHEAVGRLTQREENDNLLESISGREQECLLWAAEGKTTWETAQILNISERTVLFHMQNAMKKLGAANKSHAVARAICYGIISPS
ncbi:MAG: LuxR family transcriptional regulator [Gammaproteobacteria bacterium]|nr:LuxR family transcriptional regulator [Gammaproteobacteria bacterium]